MEDKNIFEGLNNDEGAEYTVTPEGGFYTKQKDEIIQDEHQNERSQNDFDYIFQYALKLLHKPIIQ